MAPASTNLYGDLYTELYERLHPTALEDELAFFLSYAQPDSRILEPLYDKRTAPAPPSCSGDFPSTVWIYLNPCWGGSGKRLRTPV